MAAAKPGAPAGGRRRLTREARREQILQAALTAFSRGGYHATHVADVIREAGIARGTFYLHFDSKHAVFEALVDRTLQILLDVRPAETEPPVHGRADAEAILRMSYTTVFETLHHHRALMRLLFEEAVGLEKGFRTKLEAHLRTWHTRIAETLRYFQRQEAARADLDADLAGDLILGMVERMARVHLFRARRPDIPALVEAIVAFELGGIAGR